MLLETGGSLSEGFATAKISNKSTDIAFVESTKIVDADHSDKFLPPTPFYARALVTGTGGDDMLQFSMHDILRITDTSNPDFWVAENLTRGGSGRVMSETRHLASLRSGFRDPVLQPLSAHAFQYIISRKPGAAMVRPVIILGPSKDLIIDRLVLEHSDIFHTCVPHTTRPQQAEECDGLDYHFVQINEFESALARGEFAETLQFQSYLYGTSFDAIKAASKQGGHCVLDVSDPHTIASLEEVGMYPISIFLHPASVECILQQSPGLSCEAADLVYTKSQELEELFRGLYSATIENNDIEAAYSKVYETILAEASKPVWVPMHGAFSNAEDGSSTTANAALAQLDQSQPQPEQRGATEIVSPSNHPRNASVDSDSSPERSVGRRRSSGNRRKSLIGTESILLEKKGKGLGFSFAGGVDTPSSPGDSSIYVTKIAIGGTADLDGRLQVGDRLVEVNGQSLENVTHAQAGQILRDSGQSVHLRITRKCRRVTLKAESGIFGLGIKGGADAGGRIVISRVAENSPAARHPRLQLGFEITHVNNVNVHDMTHAQVLAMIRSSKDELDLIVHPRRSLSMRKLKSQPETPEVEELDASKGVPGLEPMNGSVSGGNDVGTSDGDTNNDDAANNPFSPSTSQPAIATAPSNIGTAKLTAVNLDLVDHTEPLLPAPPRERPLPPPRTTPAAVPKTTSESIISVHAHARRPPPSPPTRQTPVLAPSLASTSAPLRTENRSRDDHTLNPFFFNDSGSSSMPVSSMDVRSQRKFMIV